MELRNVLKIHGGLRRYCTSRVSLRSKLEYISQFHGIFTCFHHYHLLLDLRAAPMIIAWFWKCSKKHYQQTYFLLQGKILHDKYVVDKVECWSLCKSYNDGCKWFSYLIESNECYLFARCNNFNGNFHLPSVSGQAECKYDKVSGE